MADLRATILLLTYNSADLVEEAIAGALAQTVPCQILVSDDASPDGTGERIERALVDYRGPHEVRVFRNPVNLGLGAHLSARMADATGDVIVLMAGDDVSYPDRVQRMLELYADPAVMVAGGDYDKIDEAGNTLGRGSPSVPERFDVHYFANAGRFRTLLGAAMSFRREVFDRFGPLHAIVEDNALTMRGMLLGIGARTDAPVIRYRVAATSLSGWVFAKGGDRTGDAFVRRYRRLTKMYRDVADDLDHALTLAQGLPEQRLQAGRQLARMYRLEADQREVILDRPRREWIAPLWRGIVQPGLRRKSLERAVKLLLPRAWFGRSWAG